MRSYLDILRYTYENGRPKGNRTGTRALTVFGETFKHDMSKGFPLVTTKKMPLRTIAVELEGFIGGITDKAWYQERGCRIWDEWANDRACEEFYNENYKQPHEREVAEHGPGGCCGFDDFGLIPYEHVKPMIAKAVMDLGPIYGYQWRKFNKTYTEGEGLQNEDDGDWNNYTDQLKVVVERLKTDPNDRRGVISAWNPNQIHLMALPPCHYAMNFVHIDGKLNLTWKQRSCDMFLGVPFNIASYALLLLIVSKEVGLEPGILKGDLDDCHIYENHVPQVEQQLGREPYESPKVDILSGGLWDWTHKKLKLNNYKHHPKLSAEVAV